jgi:iron complex outermembrane receptor protein
MKTISTVVFILLFPVFGVSQILEGMIVNAEGAAIPDAIIRILNTTKIAFSDSSGNYSFDDIEPGNYVVETKALGYSSAITQILIKDSVHRLNFTLQLNIKILHEVTVTANKREEDLTQVPISITTLSSEKIEQTNTNDLSNLTGLVPNYQYGNLGVGYQQQIALRGISVFSENPAVATYIDGVCAMDIASNGVQLFDVERIEILRGPQGTLYGRNAMGGVINIITKAPTNKYSAFVQTSLGNQGLQKYGFGVRFPLVKDKLFLGMSGQYQKQFGFYTNDLSNSFTFLHQPLKGSPTDGLRMGDEESYYGNIYLKWLVNSKFDITVNSKIQSDQSIGASSYYQAVENDSIAITNPYKFSVNDVGTNSRKISNNSVVITSYQKKFTVRSISTFQYILQAYDKIDQDLTSFDYAYGSTYKNKLGDGMPQFVYSEELRFTSPDNTSKLKWTGGAYLFKQLYNKQYATVYKDLAFLFGSYPGIEVNKAILNNNGMALFGQIDYAITNKLIVTAGCRYDVENRKAEVSRFRVDELNNIINYTFSPETKTKQFSALSPRAVLKYSIGESQSIYASYTRGFRAGGINMYTNKPEYSFFNPEYSDNYEVGHKIQSRNKKLMLASSVFVLFWKQLQLDLQPEPGIWITSNIGNVRAIGGEIEMSATPFTGFQLEAALGINKANYLGFNYLGIDIKDNQTIFAPKSTLFLAAQQYLPLGKKVLASLRIEWRRVGLQYFDLINTIKQTPYNLLNSKIGIATKHFDVSVWCNNIFDAQYITYAMPGYFKYSLLNRPRTVGLTFNFKISK